MPKNARMYEMGKRAFFFRGGPMDFSCATCHGEKASASACRTCPT
jgi:sulfur-oxidizing protein SoxA